MFLLLMSGNPDQGIVNKRSQESKLTRYAEDSMALLADEQPVWNLLDLFFTNLKVCICNQAYFQSFHEI